MHTSSPAVSHPRRTRQPQPVSRQALLVRRVVALLVLVLVAFVVTVGLGRVGAQAELASPVAGHAVVEPGATLWDVAVDSAPDGVDPRAQLDAIRTLNGIDGDVAAWTVVLLPAR